MVMTDRERKVRQVMRDQFINFAAKCLRIRLKSPNENGEMIVPLDLNPAQRFLHEKLEEQKVRTGMVRAIVLKGRQQGCSTYIEARFYHKTSMAKGITTFILTHMQQATQNLFKMVQRFHQYNNPLLRPHTGKSNANELEFDRLDSRYAVATAGAKGAGRSATLQLFHGSEVAFWENGEEHLAGALQAVPSQPGTEVILESTANGVGNTYHKMYQDAARSIGDFQAVFIPWFWSPEYRRDQGEDFVLDDDRESVPEGQLTEFEYARTYKLDDRQMAWRRAKIIELGRDGYWLFKQEYPATAAEAFEASSAQAFVSTATIIKARKSTVASEGSLVIGVDPSRYGDDDFAIIRRRGRRAFDPQRFAKLSIPQGARLIYQIIKAEKPKKVFVDVGGLGGGVVDMLLEMPGTFGIVIPINFGETALDPERFSRRRHEMWWDMREWLLDEGGANIPDSDTLQSDLQGPKYSYDQNDRFRLETKDAMRARGIASPDEGDALALTFAVPVKSDAPRMGMAQTEFDAYRQHDPEGGMADTDFDVF